MVIPDLGTAGVSLTVTASSDQTHLNYNSVAVAEELHIVGSATVTIHGTGLLLNGTVRLGEFGNSGNLRFGINSQSITTTSTGTILFQDINSGNSLLQTTSGKSLTIGSGILVRDTGAIGAQIGVIGGAGPFINQGTIQAEGGSEVNNDLMLFGGAGGIINEGTLRVQGVGRLRLNDSWSNSGTIEVAGGVLNLGGTTTNVGTIDRTGGTVNLTGTLDNIGDTLTLPGPGAYVLTGTINGGVIDLIAGAVLQVNNGTLDGVTVNGTINVTSGTLTVRNDVELNGTMAVAASAIVAFSDASAAANQNLTTTTTAAITLQNTSSIRQAGVVRTPSRSAPE